ncbi:12009_t:CDS:1, partial [Gigaspora rosea]
ALFFGNAIIVQTTENSYLDVNLSSLDIVNGILPSSRQQFQAVVTVMAHICMP